MGILSYLLVGEESELPQQTTTQARRGQVQVAIKRDNDENPAQVYSELVANRLAQHLGLPVAIGVPTRDSAEPKIAHFASLWVDDFDTRLFDFTEAEPDPEAPPAPDGAYNETGFYWQFKQLCDRHPVEAAQLAVTDLWMGNADRDLNIKARIDDDSMDNQPNVLFALDQGDALLSCGRDKQDSLDKLQSSEYPAMHPMAGLLGEFECGMTVERINALPEWALMSAVVCDMQVGSVTPDVQYTLLDVLDQRRKLLPDLVKRILTAPM